MADLAIEGRDLVVRLTLWEQFAALTAGVRMPLSAVRGVHVTDAPWREVRGLRVGTAIPGVILLGRMLRRSGVDFVAIYRGAPTTVVELAPGARYRRLFVSGVPAGVVDAIQASMSARSSSSHG